MARLLSPLPRWSRNSPSIALRLTLSQALVSLLLLATTTGLLYSTLGTTLDWAQDQFVAERIEIIASMFTDNNASSEEVIGEIIRETGARSPARLYIRVLDDNGHVVAESSGMGNLLPTTLFPKPVVWKSGAVESIDLTSSSGTPFRAAAVVVAHSMPAHAHTLQVGVDGAEEGALLNSYRSHALIVVFISLVLFTASTWFITRRGLRPIAALSGIASQVGPNCMHPRLDVSAWPAELTGLARGFDLMLDRLEENFQSLQQFSADIAHELRTPLSILRGEAEVALAQTRTTEEYRELLASALEEYQRLSSLVDSLLFLARAEHDSKPITKAKLDARSEALAVCAFYEALAMERGVAVEVSGNGELYAESILLRRALSNLLSNSLSHTPANGIVRITIQYGNESGIDIVVSDSGSGIAKEHLPKILNRFYRADTARARNGEGIGLGLAIVKSIMTLHSGAIAVRSAPGKGTTVVLSFP